MDRKLKVAVTCAGDVFMERPECGAPLAEAGIGYEAVSHWGGGYAERLKGYDCVIAGGEPFNKRVLDQMPDLKLIVRHGVGYDAVDHGYAAKLGIAAMNLPGCNSESVAEFALTLMLCVTHNVVGYHAGIVGWPRHHTVDKAMEGTVGLIGFGAIARSLASMLRPFPFDRILAYDPYVDAGVMEGHGVVKCGLEDIRREADIISLHLPSMPETDRMVDGRFLSGLGKRAILINTARGALIDEEALIRALECGDLAGAGLDVTDPEPMAPDSPLKGLPNVVLTPHVATNNLRVRIKVHTLASKAIVEFFSGGSPKGILNPGYAANARFKA
ncbi:MAG: hypothetical protein FWE70_04445 [Oscillospiraceae bacterium]|nr:hypothetical protein [Oscillospiraceae bacterium]